MEEANITVVSFHVFKSPSKKVLVCSYLQYSFAILSVRLVYVYPYPNTFIVVKKKKREKETTHLTGNVSDNYDRIAVKEAVTFVGECTFFAFIFPLSRP